MENTIRELNVELNPCAARGGWGETMRVGTWVFRSMWEWNGEVRDRLHGLNALPERVSAERGKGKGDWRENDAGTVQGTEGQGGHVRVT
jgi:hypothetical protein